MKRQLKSGIHVVIKSGIYKDFRGVLQKEDVDKKTGAAGWHILMPPTPYIPRKHLVFVTSDELSTRGGPVKNAA